MIYLVAVLLSILNLQHGSLLCSAGEPGVSTYIIFLSKVEDDLFFVLFYTSFELIVNSYLFPPQVFGLRQFARDEFLVPGESDRWILRRC